MHRRGIGGGTVRTGRPGTVSRENLVVSGPDGLRTDSLAVAELYGREHKNVLRVVRELLEDVPDYRLNFEPSSRSWVSALDIRNVSQAVQRLIVPIEIEGSGRAPLKPCTQYYKGDAKTYEKASRSN